MDAHLIKMDLSIDLILGQRGNITVINAQKVNSSFQIVKMMLLGQWLIYLLEYMSTSESFSSTIGIELIRAAKWKLLTIKL